MIRRPGGDDTPPTGLFGEPPQPSGPGRGPFFSKSRYGPDVEIETERIVPGMDTLRRDRVKGRPELPTETIVDASGDGVFETRGEGRVVAAVLVLSMVSATAGMALRACAPYLTDPRITVGWAFLMVAVFIWARGEDAPWKLAFRLALLVPGLFAIGHVAALASSTGGEAKLGTAIALAVTFFAVDRFTDHWVRMLIATGALRPGPRRAWTRAWTRRLMVQRLPGGHPRAAWAIVSYALGVAPLVWLFATEGSLGAYALTYLPVSTCLFGGLLGLRAGLGPSPVRVASSLGRAAYSWFFYGWRGMHAPGVLRSPAGPIAYRVVLLGVTFALLSATLLPPGEVLAAQVTLAGLGPLAQAGTLALLFGKLAFFPLAVFAGALLASALPVFAAFESLTDGTPDERAARAVDFITSAIATSADETVRRQVFYGYHATEGWPCVVPLPVCEGHSRITGGTGGGKTALGMLLQVKQWIGQTGAKRGPLLVVDMKPEFALFHSVRRAALEAGRTFRFFTNEWGYTSHVFNPVSELRAAAGPLVRGATSAQAALNLEAGPGHGMSFFSALNRSFLRDLLTTTPDAQSVREIVAGWKRKLPTLRPEERKRAEHSHEVLLNLETIAGKAECNVTRGKAFEARICMDRAVAKDEVIYVALSAKVDGEAVARFLGAMAVEMFYQAILRWNGARDALGRRVNPEKRGWAALDEFQLVAGRNFEVFLEEARERGLSLLLSCQSVQKLAPELRLAVETCTAVKQYFTARTPQELKDLAALGGTTMRAVFDLDGNTKLQKSDRLGTNILKTMSAEPDLSVLVVEKSADWAMFDGFPLLIRTPHCQSQAEYAAARNAPWPMYDGLVVVGSEPTEVRGTNVVPLNVPGVARPMPPAPAASSGKPVRGTPLAAMFERIPESLLGGTKASPQSGKGERSG